VIEAARQLVSQARAIVSFSGAGLSAESGIATFRDRSDPNSLWAKFDPMQLASPEGFEADPKMVIEWYAWRRRKLPAVQPNAAHHALATRSDILNITQNVDDLLERAGVPRESIVHLHGSITEDRCHGSCGRVEAIDLSDPPLLRSCGDCGAPMRPNVVWFGEMLPRDAWERAERACRGCDLLLVIGTSAEIYPAAGLIEVAKTRGAKVIVVNPNASGASHLADIEINAKAGEVLPRILAM
jgi:NAD-dependent deacetylase